MCEAYDIIDWKSCASLSSKSSNSSPCDGDDVDRQPRYYRGLGYGALSRDGICSTNDIVFPKLFNEDPESEQSGIISIADMEYYGMTAYDYLKEKPPDGYEEQSVYQKVSSWVLSQRKYFLNSDPLPIEDDELEVIAPVDLFHESILDEYFMITEDDCERRAVFRELKSTHYEIESIEEAMETHEYKFLRKPQANIDMELVPLIHFHHRYIFSKGRRDRKNSISTKSTLSTISSQWEIEREEETVDFLGVPRLLDNYVIFNREGRAIAPDIDTDLWLSPLQEDLSSEHSSKVEHEELEFLSSWFSDAYHDINTDENRTLITDKVTVISVSHCSEDEVWMDAPEIPHWLEGEDQDELELFNQPSRPLYYYRDRIKGCYRIIGVEDEMVVLFSGNDDDTIFYNEDDADFEITKTFPEPRITRNIFREPNNDRARRVPKRRRRNRSSSVDRKNDSGIEDDIVGEEVAVASLSLSNEEAAKLGYKTYQFPNTLNHYTKELRMQASESFLDWMLIALLAFIIVMVLFVFCISDIEKKAKKINWTLAETFVQDFREFFQTLKSRLKI